MPQGPGDDILDAIEAGTADDALMSKFKLNADNLKAFKSLYYGLTEDDMRYEDIGEYYPELNDYFKAAQPLAPEARPQEPAAAMQQPAGDPFKLMKERERLTKKLATSSTATSAGVGAPAADLNQKANEDYKNQIQSINADLTAQGYDPDELAKDFGDLPELENFDLKHATTLKKENPQAFDRYKAAVKSQYGLLHAVDKAEGAKAANQFMNAYQKSQYAPDYNSQRKATKEAVASVYKYVRDSDEQRKILADMVRDKSYGYGVGLPGYEEAIANDPRSQNLNPYQVSALQFLEDTDAPTAEAFNRILNFSPEEVQQLGKDSAFMRGYEQKAKELENIGMNLQRKSMEEKLTNLIAKKDSLNDEQKQDFLKLYNNYQTLTKDIEDQNKRYPAVAAMDADRLMQDAMGESKRGVVAKTLLGMGENVDDARLWVGDLITSPFMSDKETALDDLKRLGNKKLAGLSQYETEGQELFNRKFKTVFDDELKARIDKVKSDNNLTNEEKQDKVREIILRNNMRGVTFAPNDKAGKFNFTAGAVLNGVSNVVSELAPQIVLGMATGGGANASKAKELVSLFGSTFATAYNDNYVQAIEENSAHPSQKALVNTVIEAASELVTNDLSKAKQLFGGKKIGKLLEGVEEGTLSTLKKTGRFAAMKEAIANTAKTGFKNSLEEAGEEMFGQAATNVAGKYLFNEDVDLTDDVLKTGVSTFIGMLPLAGLGLPSRYKEANDMQKYALYQAASNPDKFIAQVNEELKSGQITASDADTRTKAIQKAAAVLESMNAVRSDGSVLTDNQKVKYLFNEFVKQDIKEKKKTVPAETKAQLEITEQKLDQSNERILKPKENESETKAKADNKAEAQAETAGSVVEPIAAATEPATPVAEPAQETTSQPKTPAVAVDAQEKPAEDVLHYTNKEGTKYTLKGDKLSMIDSKGKEVQFSEKAMQSKATKALIETIKAENKPVETEADVESALNAIMQAPTEQVTPEATEQQPTESKLIKEPLAKLADQTTHAPAQALGITENDNAESVLDKLIQQNDEFTPLLEKMRNMPVLKKIKFEQYERGKNPLLDKYFNALGVNPNRYAGLYFKDGMLNGTEFEPLHNTLMLGNSKNAYYDLTHEFGHVLTLDNVSTWKKIMNKSDIKLIEDIYKYIKDKKPDANINNPDQYGMASIEEFLVESIMNPAFRKYVSDVTADSKSDFLQTVRKGEARDFIQVIKEFFEKLIRQVFGQGEYAEGIDQQPLIDKAVELATKLFLEGDTDVIAATEGKRRPSIERYPNVLPGGVLAMPATSPLGDKEEAIRKLISKTPKSINNAKLNELIVNATGITPQEAQELIDEVRKPDIPLDPNKTISTTRFKEKQVAINKFKKLREKKKSNEPNWWQRQWESIRNGSAWTDNPYRFVTKITDDINKEYGLKNNEAIPLGRQFEKSAVGKAVLKVDSFVDEVIRGNIGKEKLGRLKGEKYTDFLDYLAAKRVIDRLHTQQDKRLAGEEASRQTGNVTRKDAGIMLEHLKQKYGDNIKDFEKRADALQRHMDNMLKELTAAGMISKDSYDQIKADNDFYAPFSVVQSKVYADQPKQSVGISGVVKRIKGIDYELLKSDKDELRMIDALGGALEEGIVTPEEYFSTAINILNDLKQQGRITEEEYNQHIATLENPGFAINDILDAAANMIYKSQGMILKNTMLQRLYGYKAYDTEGLFIQDVDGFTPVTRPDGTVVMAPKPLNSIKVEPGMGAIKMRVDGKEKFVAVNKHAADKLTVMNNYETATILKVSDFVNRIFRGIVITVSPGFQVRNFLIDFARTAMLSRYGPIAGKGLVEPFVNFAMFVPQYIEALLHSALGNVNIKTKTYKQWMQSDSYSKGMFDNLFDNEKRIKEVNAPLAKRILNNFINLHFITVPGSILEQTHKIATHQRGASVEGLKPEMFTALLASTINGNINPNMTDSQLKDATDRLNYEVQNMAGSPNFPQTHRWMKMASIFLQFFSARVKGEVTDYRRVLNMFGMKSAEGVKLTAQDRAQLLIQFLSITGAIAAFAILNNADDDDEKEFDSIAPFHRDNYINIPLGYFDYEDEDGRKYKLRDYAKVPLRGLSATINVMANSFVKYYKRQNPEDFKKMALAFAGNASPVNLNGSDMREYGESLTSNLTPLFKFFIEYSFNRDTHNHRNVIPDFVQGRGMLSKYRAGDLKPWDVFTKKTPQWAIDMSKYLYDKLGIEVSAIELDHMENTMGNPTELYQKALKKSLFRSESKFPLYESPEETKNTSSTTAIPVVE
jgi:hypothetical protein